MKATIQIPDDLYRRVKAQAALRGRTIRDVTTELYRRWLGEEEGAGLSQNPTEWLRGWLSAADEAVDAAPPGPSAREELTASRNRLERQ
ncbi:MAG: hypothetical protein MJB57_14300 [Gemmatimonadetes bacterium]|nr:hypothetical protein [Gemmatimonadota bacterium]